MTEKTANLAFGQSLKAFWHALFLIVPVTVRSLWVLIANINKPQVKKSEKIWDMISEHMDTYAENEGIKKTDAKRDEKLKKYLKSNDVVLDYGCGTGTIAIEYAGIVKKIHGIDFSGKMIEIAQIKAAQNNVENVDFTQSIIFDEKLEKESYNVVLAWGILHLVDDRPDVIKRINKLLKPGGLLISATECMAENKSSITSLISFLMKLRIFPIMLKFFKVSELEESITSADFEILETEILTDNPVDCFIAAKKPLGK